MLSATTPVPNRTGLALEALRSTSSRDATTACETGAAALAASALVSLETRLTAGTLEAVESSEARFSANTIAAGFAALAGLAPVTHAARESLVTLVPMSDECTSTKARRTHGDL